MAIPRRDWTPATPAFVLTDHNLVRLAECEAMCARQCVKAAATIELELEQMHRAHCYKHRPILGLANSLTVLGDLAFDRDWTAHRDEHMAEARAAYRAARAVELERAA